MKSPTHSPAGAELVGLLSLTVALWLGYLLALLLIDHTFYPFPVFAPAFYVASTLTGLLVLGLVHYAPLRLRLGRVLLPLVIVLLSVESIALAELVTMFRGGPPATPEGLLLRTMPLLLLGLILTAWQYGWRFVVLYTLGIALFSAGLILQHVQDGQPPAPPLTMLIIQTVSFLVVGYFISTLMQQLQAEQASLAQANAQLRQNAATVEQLAISRERNRMARELHDTLAHTLSALSVQLETVKAYWEVDPEVAQKMLDQSLQATRAGLHETRRALKSLRASPLDDLGLLLALRRMAEQTAVRSKLKLQLALPSQAPPLAPATEQAIYRIAQEAVANVAHHADATTLSLTLSLDDARVILVVHDDGLGFNPQQRARSGHFGLSGMEERAQMVGGNLTVSSRPGDGTTVRFTLEEQAHERVNL